MNEYLNVCFTWFAQLIQMENSLENYVLTYIMTLSVLTLQEKYRHSITVQDFKPLFSIFCVYKIELTTFLL